MGRRCVAHQRFVRPVVGIGNGLAGPLRHRGPGRPPDERGERVAMFGRIDGPLLHRVRLAQLEQLWIAAKQRFVVSGDGADRRDALCRQRDGVGLRIVGIDANRRLQLRLQPCLLVHRQFSVVVRGLVARRDVEPFGGFAMEPVGRPVGRDVTSMTPDGTQLVSTDGLPDLAALFEFGMGVENGSALAEHGLRNRRHHAVDLAADPQENPERNQQQADQEHPELASSHGHLQNDDPSLLCGGRRTLIQVRCALFPRPTPSEYCGPGPRVLPDP